jgi:hypothetical protein
VEERRSWLPAGLESSRWEPDDRSSQRSDRRGKGRGEGPTAAADQPYDEDRREQRQEQRGRSDVDALGQDKHRQVVGQRYSLSRARQLLFYGIFVAFLIAAFIGLRAAADQLDKAPAHDPDKAPWSRPSAPQGPLGGFEPRKPGQKGPTHFQ